MTDVDESYDGESDLIRQVHPNFYYNGRGGSQVFLPDRDNRQLSVDIRSEFQDYN
mgnify:CR=1 FL=1